MMHMHEAGSFGYFYHLLKYSII